MIRPMLVHEVRLLRYRLGYMFTSKFHTVALQEIQGGQGQNLLVGSGFHRSGPPILADW